MGEDGRASEGEGSLDNAMYCYMVVHDSNEVDR
jgi:hypothetical protein